MTEIRRGADRAGGRTSVCSAARRAAKVAWTACVVAAIGVAAALPARADDEGPSVTPYRPSVSAPAALSAPGWLELEAGGTAAKSADAGRRSSLPYTLKLAFTPDWGIRLGGDAWVRQTDPDGSRRTGGGDTSIVLKRRFGIDDARAFGVELAANVATAGDGLGAGRSSLGLTGIYSADLRGGLHTDLNLGTARATGADPGTSRTQWAGAAALSGTIVTEWGWVAELSGTRQRGAGVTSHWLAAVSYSVSRRLTLDFGLSRSLREPRSDGAWFAGVTVLTARVF